MPKGGIEMNRKRHVKLMDRERKEIQKVLNEAKTPQNIRSFLTDLDNLDLFKHLDYNQIVHSKQQMINGIS